MSLRLLKRIPLIYAQEHKTEHLTGPARVQAPEQLDKLRMETLTVEFDALAPKCLTKRTLQLSSAMP